MNQKVEKILGFAVRFILLKAFWVFPAVYLLVSMLTYIFGAEGHFSFPEGILYRDRCPHV